MPAPSGGGAAPAGSANPREPNRAVGKYRDLVGGGGADHPRCRRPRGGRPPGPQLHGPLLAPRHHHARGGRRGPGDQLLPHPGQPVRLGPCVAALPAAPGLARRGRDPLGRRGHRHPGERGRADTVVASRQRRGPGGRIGRHRAGLGHPRPPRPGGRPPRSLRLSRSLAPGGRRGGRCVHSGAGRDDRRTPDGRGDAPHAATDHLPVPSLLRGRPDAQLSVHQRRLPGHPSRPHPGSRSASSAGGAPARRPSRPPSAPAARTWLRSVRPAAASCRRAAVPGRSCSCP